MSGITGRLRPSIALLRASLLTETDTSNLPDPHDESADGEQEAQEMDSIESPEAIQEHITEIQADLATVKQFNRRKRGLLEYIEERTANAQSVREELQAQSSRLRELETENSHLQNRPTVEVVVDAVRAAKQPLEQETADAKGQICSLNTQIMQLKIENTKLWTRPTTEELSEAVRVAVSHLEEELAASKQNTVQAEQDAGTLRMKNIQLQEDISGLERRPTTEELSQAVMVAETSLQQKLAASEKDNKYWREANIRLEASNKDLQKRPTIETQRDAIDEAVGPLQHQLNECRVIVEELQQRPTQKSVDQQVQALHNSPHAILFTEKKELDEASARSKGEELYTLRRRVCDLEQDVAIQTNRAKAMKTRLAIADTASKEARDLFEEIISELRCQVNKDQDQLYDERSKHYQVLSDTNSARRHVADMHARECRSKDMLAQTLQHEVDEHGMRLKDAQTDIDLMKSDVRRLQTEYLSLKASCNEKDKQLDAANSSLQQSHKDFAELQKENSAIRLVRQQLNDQIFALHGEIETVTASNKDLKRTKDEHITQIDHQKRDADLLRSANESLEKKFDDVESQVRVHEQEQKSHKETISKLQQDFHTLSHDIGTFQNPASKEHETMKELHNFKDDCENLESARLDLLAFLYSRLGFKAPENTCAAFEEDHTAPGGLSVQTKERIKECSAVLDLKEHIQANNTVNLESAYRTMALLTERVNDLHKQLIAPIECGCAADIQTLLTRNEELEKDVDDLMASLQEALNKHEAITTDLASNLDYVNGELKTVTSAYDELVAYVDGKVKAGKVT